MMVLLRVDDGVVKSDCIKGATVRRKPLTKGALGAATLLAAALLGAACGSSQGGASAGLSGVQVAAGADTAGGQGAAGEQSTVDLDEFLDEALAPFQDDIGGADEEAPATDAAADAGGAGAEPAEPEPATELEPAADTDTAVDDGDLGESEPAVETVEPEEIEIVAEVLVPLTGELTSDLSVTQRRAVAAKVDNGGLAPRPQFGLAAADIVYEELVEGGFTRFLAVFHSEIPSRIGPVRSVRSSDFDLLADLSEPYLVSSGANNVVLQQMREAVRSGTLIDAGALRGVPAYSLDHSRPAPHNRFFHYQQLFESTTATSTPASVAPVFEYGTSNPPPIAGAAGVTVDYSRFNNTVSHIWDADIGGWVRIQQGALHTTETDFGTVEIAPTNVVVLEFEYQTSAADPKSPQALSYGSGDALVLTAGSVHEATWERTESLAGFRLTDAQGNALSLSPGSTWVLLANQSPRFPEADIATVSAPAGAFMLAAARAAAAQADSDAGTA